MRTDVHSTIEQLDARLKDFGMEVLGVFDPLAGEPGFANSAHDDADDTDDAGDRMTGLMIASGGRRMWPIFRSSLQFNDGKADPLNRWSAEVLGQLAVEFDAVLGLPFERPFLPFQSWALRTGVVETSPLGILLHPRYGLWFGLRAVLFVNVEHEQVDNLIQEPFQRKSICNICIKKPCLSCCPVNAFGDGSLNVDDCFFHLDQVEKSGALPNCTDNGCAARSACPVAADHKYCNEQLRFHMDAYIGKM